MFTSPDTELQFLVNCIKPADISISAADISNLDWCRLTDLAVRHRLIPLVYRKLQSMSAATAPPHVSADFEQKNIANSVRNAFLCAELVKALDILKVAPVDIIPFKGPVLALEAYGDVSMRQFDDIDMLVRKKDILDSTVLMLKKGYKPFIEMPDKIRSYHVKAGWGVSLRSPETDYHLELISNVLPDLFSFQLPDELIWNKTTELIFETRKISTLSPECNLVLLCVHGMKHQWSRLSWVADAAHFLKSKPDINWEIILEITEKSGSRLMLLLGLHLVNTLAGTTLRNDIAKMIEQDKHIPLLASKVIDTYASIDEPDDSSKREIMFHLESRERLTDKLHYLLSLLFVPGYSDWQTLKLPFILTPLYYITRPFRLMFSAIRRLILNS